MAVSSRRASWSVLAVVCTITWQPGIIFGGYLMILLVTCRLHHI